MNNFLIIFLPITIWLLTATLIIFPSFFIIKLLIRQRHRIKPLTIFEQTISLIVLNTVVIFCFIQYIGIVRFQAL